MPQKKKKSPTTKKKKTTPKCNCKCNQTKQGGFIPIAPLLAGLAGSLLPNLLGIGRGLTLPGTRRPR
jgi:hypothetical protein